MLARNMIVVHVQIPLNSLSMSFTCLFFSQRQGDSQLGLVFFHFLKSLVVVKGLKGTFLGLVHVPWFYFVINVDLLYSF